MVLVLRSLVLCVFLHLCSARVLDCTATQDGDQTTYEIQHISAVKASSCEYTWANESKHVLAHNKAQNPKLVMKNSINTLVTSRCFGKIIYEQSCVSEEEGYTADCTIICSEHVMVQVEDIPPSLIAAAAAGGGVIILVLVVLLVFLCYKFRDKITRMCSWSQFRCIYTAVKKPDVEAGNE